MALVVMLRLLDTERRTVWRQSDDARRDRAPGEEIAGGVYRAGQMALRTRP
ncbi:hypothetical protein Lfu02_51790 [Longispora fulva]|nr:hypothetical protein Lfu02_51790 [Longispora fulva]